MNGVLASWSIYIEITYILYLILTTEIQMTQTLKTQTLETSLRISNKCDNLYTYTWHLRSVVERPLLFFYLIIILYTHENIEWKSSTPPPPPTYFIYEMFRTLSYFTYVVYCVFKWIIKKLLTSISYLYNLGSHE